MARQKNSHILIIGGGLSGLAAAYLIQEESRAAGLAASLTLVEAEPHLGGKIRTLSENWDDRGPFRCETGPNGFLDSKPDTLALCRRMGIEGRLLRSSDEARKRFIFSAGALRRLPEDPLSFAGSDLISAGGKARIAAEVLVPARRESSDETLGDFARRRLGQEALEVLIGPMASGVFAGDPENMSLAACFPKVDALERRFGGMVRGMLAMKKAAAAAGRQVAASAGPGGTLMSFKEGMNELVSLIADRIDGKVLTGTAAAGLAPRVGGGFRVSLRRNGSGESMEADVVVLAVPAYTGAALLSEADPGVAATMHTIPYSSMAVVHLGFERAAVSHSLDGFGYLIPFREKRRILGALWSSSIFTGRAPRGMVLVTAMVGGAKDPVTPRLPRDDVLAVAREELAATMGLCAEPSIVRVLQWERAIPQYTYGHLNRVRSIRSRLLQMPGLFLTGNAYAGIGVNDCVASGQETARQVASFLAGRERMV